MYGNLDINEFEDTCGICFKKNNNQELKLLIGSQPYLRNIRISNADNGYLPIRVSIKDFPTFNIELGKFPNVKVEKGISLTTSDKKRLQLMFKRKKFYDTYKNFGEIAFLTNQWKDVSLSLVKILSLLFDSENAALKAIVYFREKDVSTFDFARYLYEEHNLLLLNTMSLTDEEEPDIDNSTDILAFLKKKQKRFSLVIGSSNKMKIVKLRKKCEYVKVPHPSSSIISTDDFYEVWVDHIITDSIDETYMNTMSNNDVLQMFILTEPTDS